MVRGGDTSGLDAWITSAAESELSGLATVAAAITGPWSMSPVEGHVNRLKTLKRQMCGRTGYDVLRAGMLAA